MDSSALQYELKLRKLLSKFLEPGYRLGNDVYLNILLSHLSGKNNQELGAQLRGLCIFPDWLETAITQWETTSTIPSASICTFTLNLTSLISTNELIFVKLNLTSVYVRLIKVLDLRANNIAPSVKLGYLKMLQSFLNHRSGLDWLVVRDNWADILQYCLENQTIYITRDGCNFMYDLISKFITIHPEFCELIVKQIVDRLDNFNESIRSPEIDDIKIAKEIIPTLKLITFILEKSFLSKIEHEHNKIPKIFIQNYNLEDTLWKLLIISRDGDLLFNVSKPLYITIFALIDKDQMTNKNACCAGLKEFARKFFKIFNTLINKRSAVNILKLCQLGHIYWDKIVEFVPAQEGKENPIFFENQLIIFQIMPLLYIAFSTAYKTDIKKDELTEMFVHKLFKISCEHTIRCAYSYRALLMSYDNRHENPVRDPAIFDYGQKAIYYLMKTQSHFHRDRAVIVFQALMYAMKYLSKTMTDKTAVGINLLTHQTGFLSAMFDGLSMLIKEFKITWRESVETICLTSLTLDFLSIQTLPTKVSVQCLQLIHLSIANFMPPNLALLVNEISDTSIIAITPMLYNKLYDKNWEIRDSALEILNTVVEIAHLKFPAFQKLVKDDHLCQLTVVLAVDDSESFVRASAIKCITSMIKVPYFWNQCLELEQLTEKMMQVLQNETEAIVRCEATKLICEIYEHQFISSDLLRGVYTAMGSAVTHDLHWEVKVNALNFWGNVINNEMCNQGMIDGVFPSVTFSKENKKIVSLTEPEIQNRLNKVLLNLSECGCLGVLLNAMQDDCDIQVSRKAVEITKKLTDVLRKHNTLGAPDAAVEIDRSVWDTFNNYNRSLSSEHNTPMISENIIDSIVNVSDMNLLGSVYLNNQKEPQTNGDVRELMIITPEVFKNFVAKDLDKIVEEKSKWLENIDDLNSLLDDILQSYEDNEVNAMDCY